MENNSTKVETPKVGKPTSAWVESELRTLAGFYLTAAIIASCTASLSGYGSHFDAFMVFAIASGLLMLRPSKTSRLICMLILLISIVGMKYQREIRDEWRANFMRVELDRMEKKAEAAEAKAAKQAMDKSP
jgi:hypothetical protein